MSTTDYVVPNEAWETLGRMLPGIDRDCDGNCNLSFEPVDDVGAQYRHMMAAHDAACCKQTYSVPIWKACDVYSGGIDVAALIDDIRDELGREGFVDRLTPADLRRMLLSCITQTDGVSYSSSSSQQQQQLPPQSESLIAPDE
jgi:hypothetical protein